MITCLAVWAPIRPESSAVSSGWPSWLPVTLPLSRSISIVTTDVSPNCRVSAVTRAASIA
jgi:hypothetical protein